ncbi:MAG: hypothetical protein AAGJ28_03480 [Pseudomonadota bacterium]
MTMIGFGLTVGSVRKSDGTVTTPPSGDPEVTLDALPRDRMVFDSGAAVGLAEADIALSGTATAGQVIEARAISVTGAPVTGWISVATTAANGTWTGTLTAVPRSTDWLVAQARPAGTISAQAQSAERFGVGHVIAIWGQSENAKFYGEPPSTPAVALADPEALQVIYGVRPANTPDDTIDIQHVFVDGTVANNTLIEMSNVFAAERPGEKFVLAMQTKSGTGWYEVFTNSENDRSFATDQAIHNYVVADGLTQVGICTSSWFNSNRTAGLNYEELFFPIMFGVTADGTPVTPGTPVEAIAGQTTTYDHALTELYDYSRTRWVAQGPHRFDPVQASEVLVSGLVTAADGLSSNARFYEQCRISWREAAQNPNGQFIGGVGPDLIFMQNGEGDATTWNDVTHPAADNPDGLQMLGKQMMHGVLRGTGLTSWPVPVFDSFAVAPDGAYVDWWSSAGPITTARKSRGLPALDPATQAVPADFTHWTEVMGIEINDRWAERAEIVDDQGNPALAGRVRVYPNGGGVFRAADVIRFGRGYAAPIKFEAPDSHNRTYLNLPIVDLGLAHVDGVAVSALPTAPDLTTALVDSSIPATGHAITGVSGSAPAFTGDNIPVDTTKVTLDALMRVPEAVGQTTGFQTYLDAHGDAWKVEIQGTTQSARLKIRDTTGASLVSNLFTEEGALPIGRWIRLRLAFDTTAGWVKMFVDDALVVDQSFTPGNALSTARYPRIGMTDLDLGSYRLWYDAQTDGGTEALGTPVKTLEGTAVEIAADPWRTAAGTITSTTYFGQSTFSVTSDVAISGTPAIGATLSAVPAVVDPSDGARSYQWRRNGTDIGGATGTSYVVDAADEGTDLTVVETITKTDYAPVLSTSAALSIAASQASGTFVDMTGEAASAAAFQGPNIPASSSRLTIVCDMEIPGTNSGFTTFFRATGQSWDISFRPEKGSVRFTIRDSASTVVANKLATADDVFAPDTRFAFRFVADLTSQEARMFIDDVEVGAWSIGAGSGTFSAVRVPQVVPGGTTLTLFRYRQWYDAVADFSVPGTTPEIDLDGDAAALAASAWRTANGTLS